MTTDHSIVRHSISFIASDARMAPNRQRGVSEG